MGLRPVYLSTPGKVFAYMLIVPVCLLRITPFIGRPAAETLGILGDLYHDRLYHDPLGRPRLVVSPLHGDTHMITHACIYDRQVRLFTLDHHIAMKRRQQQEVTYVYICINGTPGYCFYAKWFITRTPPLWKMFARVARSMSLALEFY